MHSRVHHCCITGTKGCDRLCSATFPISSRLQSKQAEQAAFQLWSASTRRTNTARRCSRWCHKLRALADSQARELLAKAKKTYEKGDRMGALRIYETSLKQLLTPKERQEALYGATVVHASFGDIELAQMTLREGIESGLDFEKALDDSSLVKWKSAPQVLSQLKKFARTLRQIREAVQPSSKRVAQSSSPSGGLDLSSPSARIPRPNPEMNLSEMLRTDITGMDATVTGIIKRVFLLLVVGLLLGTAMFYIGLEFSGIAR